MKIRLFTLPNLLTLMNLFCGCMAIVFAMHQGNLKIAFLFVILAAVFDFFDGFVARLLNMSAEIGVQLDSLSDMVSFGVAPSIFLYMLYISEGGVEWFPFGIYIVFLVAMFSALRLAKFNIDETQTEEFVGLPTPACAILITSAGYLYVDGLFSIAPLWILVITAVLSWLLISPIRMFSLKFKDFTLKNNAIRYIFLILSIVALVVFKMVAIPFIIIGYIVISIVRHLVLLRA